jgi:hypothetical protein
LIEDLHELPFLDLQIEPFAISAADWTRAVIISFYLYRIFQKEKMIDLIHP